MARNLIPDPYGCDDCGTERDGHGTRHSKSAGSHQWITPPDWKIKLRMQARRIARQDGAK